MSTMQDLEAKAEFALRARDIATFMTVLDDMAEHKGSWSAGFALRTAALVKASSAELGRWADLIARGMTSGGEDAAQIALARRSQLELAKDLYRGTEAMPTLDFLWDPVESDDELRKRAEQVGLYGPDYLPASHRWWKGSRRYSASLRASCHHHRHHRRPERRRRARLTLRYGSRSRQVATSWA